MIKLWLKSYNMILTEKLQKVFKKQIKTIEDQGEKQIKALEDLKANEETKSIEIIFPEAYESVEIKNEINKIEEYEKNIETI